MDRQKGQSETAASSHVDVDVGATNAQAFDSNQQITVLGQYEQEAGGDTPKPPQHGWTSLDGDVRGVGQGSFVNADDIEARPIELSNEELRDAEAPSPGQISKVAEQNGGPSNVLDEGLAIHRIHRQGHLDAPTYDPLKKKKRSVVTDSGHQIYKANQDAAAPTPHAPGEVDGEAGEEDPEGFHDFEDDDDDQRPQTLQDRLFQALEETRHPQDTKQERFLPKSQLDELVNVMSVAEELRRVLQGIEGAKRIKAMAKQVCSDTWIEIERAGKRRRVRKSFRQIFAILALVNKTNTISLFLQGPREVSDLDLPLVRAERSGKLGLRRRDRNARPTAERLACFEHWDTITLDWFEKTQWQLLAPYFSRDSQKMIRHYKLHDNSVLPFVASPSPSVNGQEARENAGEVEGGYARVFMVNIHPDHHNFRDVHYPGRGFAIKQLRDRNWGKFEREVEILKKFSEDRPDPHIVSLLATYEHGQNLHLLFHRAEGNLHQLWTKIQRDPDPERHSPLWLSKQLTGIANGLLRLHQHYTSRLSAGQVSSSAVQGRKLESLVKSPDTGDTITSQQSAMVLDGALPEVQITVPPDDVIPPPVPIAGFVSPRLSMGKGFLRFGRHTDITPNNILWFNHQPDCAGGILKIADFGLSEFHSERSKSAFKSDLESWLPYRPPECDLAFFEPQRIRQTYDIWSLGCVYLEFVTWILGGAELFERFASARKSLDWRCGMTTLVFFELRPDEESTKGSDALPEKRFDKANFKAFLKPQVEDFIEELHAHENCTNYIHELLLLIKEDMLVVATEGGDKKRNVRRTCKWVAGRLEQLHSKCEADEGGYCSAKIPWPRANVLRRSTPRDPAMGDAATQFARMWKYCHLFQSNLGMGHGEGA